MNSFGIVTKCDKEFAYVKIKRDSMCGESCGSCNMCANKEIEIKAVNEKGARVGDMIEMEMPEKSGFSAAFLAYGAPMLILILGILTGAGLNKESIALLVTAILIIMWYAVLMCMEKSKKYSSNLTPVIVKIIKEEKNA